MASSLSWQSTRWSLLLLWLGCLLAKAVPVQNITLPTTNSTFAAINGNSSSLLDDAVLVQTFNVNTEIEGKLYLVSERPGRMTAIQFANFLGALQDDMRQMTAFDLVPSFHFSDEAVSFDYQRVQEYAPIHSFELKLSLLWPSYEAITLGNQIPSMAIVFSFKSDSSTAAYLQIVAGPTPAPNILSTVPGNITSFPLLNETIPVPGNESTPSLAVDPLPMDIALKHAGYEARLERYGQGHGTMTKSQFIDLMLKLTLTLLTDQTIPNIPSSISVATDVAEFYYMRFNPRAEVNKLDLSEVINALGVVAISYGERIPAMAIEFKFTPVSRLAGFATIVARNTGYSDDPTSLPGNATLPMSGNITLLASTNESSAVFSNETDTSAFSNSTNNSTVASWDTFPLRHPGIRGRLDVGDARSGSITQAQFNELMTKVSAKLNEPGTAQYPNEIDVATDALAYLYTRVNLNAEIEAADLLDAVQRVSTAAATYGDKIPRMTIAYITTEYETLAGFLEIVPQDFNPSDNSTLLTTNVTAIS